ncbi:DUF202 domain-containing protein [Algoriphagus mannitolivorans]|uniref:DUF202 domain-containing protein n=1 Tax=Algoriphagus mannitolivorans TaxID=226504 RepID=UPI00040C51CF|nr:DUF202 domain-containing protein [Algoriphagus mannitolivorans]
MEEHHKESEISESKKAKKRIQLERARAAFERLQLAWIRTSFTILAFGVVVYEFFFNRVATKKSPLFETFTGRELALVLYILSFIMLSLSLFQHMKSMRTLKESYPDSRYSVAALLSILLLVLALSLVGLILFKA